MYKHPILGVNCLTVSEFWASEAKLENKNVEDLIEDYVSSLKEEEDKEINRIILDKEGLLSKLKSYYDPNEYEEVTYLPLEVVNITDVFVSFGIRNKTTLKADVIFSDSKVRKLNCVEYEFGGSYYEPPDYEFSCEEMNN